MSEFPRIEEDLCISCNACVAICEKGVFAIEEDEKVVVANPEQCVRAGDCAKICPTEAIILPWKGVE